MKAGTCSSWNLKGSVVEHFNCGNQWAKFFYARRPSAHARTIRRPLVSNDCLPRAVDVRRDCSGHRPVVLHHQQCRRGMGPALGLCSCLGVICGRHGAGSTSIDLSLGRVVDSAIATTRDRQRASVPHRPMVHCHRRQLGAHPRRRATDFRRVGEQSDADGPNAV